jgi:hypothetical protein
MRLKKKIAPAAEVNPGTLLKACFGDTGALRLSAKRQQRCRDELVWQ